MKEKLQKIIDNHCKQFCELSEDKFPTPLWREMMKNLGCFFELLDKRELPWLSFGEKVVKVEWHGGQYIFLNDPSFRPTYKSPSTWATVLVPNDIALKILSLGYLP